MRHCSRFTLFFLVIVLLALAACAPTPQASTATPPLIAPTKPVTPTNAPTSPAPSATSVPTIAAKTTTSNEIRFSDAGSTSFGSWQANIVTSPAKWTPGAQLQVQTNAITVGLSTNWVAWPGSTGTNYISVPIASTNETVFLRLVYPPQ